MLGAECLGYTGLVVIRYRTFRNSDPPQLAALWRSAAQAHANWRPLSSSLFEEYVTSKPYFDSAGLIVAESDGKPAGFAHAGFGPTPDGSTLSSNVGVMCMVVVSPVYRGQGIGRELLQRCETYLREKGASEIYAGGIAPYVPFYWGFYGGSEPAGVMASDAAMQKLCQACGYKLIRSYLLMSCPAANLKTTINRQQMALRRSTQLTVQPDPSYATWWQACTLADFQCTRATLAAKEGGQMLATSLWCTMDPLSLRDGGRSIGLLDVSVPPESRQQGIATYLLGEVMKQWFAQDFAVVETQVPDDNAAMLKLLARLGFSERDRGLVYWKSIAPANGAT